MICKTRRPYVRLMRFSQRDMLSALCPIHWLRLIPMGSTTVRTALGDLNAKHDRPWDFDH